MWNHRRTYVMRDVVPWARSSLGVVQDPQRWIVAGYSNGGACATYFDAKYPRVFANVLSASPIEYAGADHDAAALLGGLRAGLAELPPRLGLEPAG